MYLSIRFYADKGQWAIRLCASGWRGMNAPLRTLHGNSLELLCATMQSEAEAKWVQMKDKLLTEAKEADKRHARQVRDDFREIEAMHHTAGDY